MILVAEGDRHGLTGGKIQIVKKQPEVLHDPGRRHPTGQTGQDGHGRVHPPGFRETMAGGGHQGQGHGAVGQAGPGAVPPAGTDGRGQGQQGQVPCIAQNRPGNPHRPAPANQPEQTVQDQCGQQHQAGGGHLGRVKIGYGGPGNGQHQGAVGGQHQGGKGHRGQGGRRQGAVDVSHRTRRPPTGWKPPSPCADHCPNRYPRPPPSRPPPYPGPASFEPGPDSGHRPAR